MIMARSAKILGKFSLKLAKMGKNSLKTQNFYNSNRKFFHQVALFLPCFLNLEKIAY